MSRYLFSVVIALFYASPVFSQSVNRLSAIPTDEKILVDGELVELAWQQQPVVNTFLRNFPDNESDAAFTTEVWITYNSEHLYVAAKMYRNPNSTYSIASLQRDFAVLENDAFGIIIDPFQDKTNGYGFYVNAGGAWRDEQIAQGTIADATWDTKWIAEVKRTNEYWTAEFEIPFKYFRNKGGDDWNVNFVRNDKGANERSSYGRVPINFLLHNLAFTNSIVWQQSIKEVKKNISIIPSLTLTGTKGTDVKARGRVQPSLDAKIALSSSVNLDVTLNPDFSQTSADVFQLNLTRFELVYPENRLFFIENSDLFASFGDESWGNPVVRPFYSRRIGLKFNESIGGYVPSRIMGGSRLSGKINTNLRFGAMTVFTEGEEMEENGTTTYSPAQNYTVVAAQQKVFTRSNIQIMMANRQAFGTTQSNEFSLNRSDFNRVMALEYNFASPNDKISGKLYHHLELRDEGEKPEFARGALLNHNTRHWRNWFYLTEVSDNYSPEIGLVSRNNVKDVNVHLAYSFYPKKGYINQFEILTNHHNYWNTDGKYTDYLSISGIHMISKNTEDIWAVYLHEKNTLRAPFDPSFRNIQKLDSGYVTDFGYWRLNYSSDIRKPFSWVLVTDYGSYYGGTQSRLEGKINYRFQPYVIVGANATWMRYNISAPYNTTDIVYVGPKVDVTFNRNLYWTTFVQYNSLYHNLNVFSRLQWRFRPLSDLFIIYSNSSNTRERINTENVSVKMSVWL